MITYSKDYKYNQVNDWSSKKTLLIAKYVVLVWKQIAYTTLSPSDNDQSSNKAEWYNKENESFSNLPPYLVHNRIIAEAVAEILGMQNTSGFIFVFFFLQTKAIYMRKDNVAFIQI